MAQDIWIRDHSNPSSGVHYKICNCDQGHINKWIEYQDFFSPSFLIRERSVEGFMSRIDAAPFNPLICQSVC